MSPIHCVWAPLPAILLSALSAAQAPARARAPAEPAAYEPRLLQRFTEPSDFSLQAVLVGFEPLPSGTAVGGPLGLYGVRLRLGEGAGFRLIARSGIFPTVPILTRFIRRHPQRLFPLHRVLTRVLPLPGLCLLNLLTFRKP